MYFQRNWGIRIGMHSMNVLDFAQIKCLKVVWLLKQINFLDLFSLYNNDPTITFLLRFWVYLSPSLIGNIEKWWWIWIWILIDGLLNWKQKPIIFQDLQSCLPWILSLSFHSTHLFQLCELTHVCDILSIIIGSSKFFFFSF